MLSTWKLADTCWINENGNPRPEHHSPQPLRGAGLFIGSTIEGKIALGTSNLQLIANDENTEKITEYLKENNKGYTVFEGHGSTDKMNMIFIVLSRRETPNVLKDIRQACDNKVFVVASEVSKYAGGYGMLK